MSAPASSSQAAGAAELCGKTVLIVGATSGIGLEAAKALCAKGARCTIVGSGEQKGKRALEEIHGANPAAEVEFEQCDVTSLRAVARFASEWRRRHSRLDALLLIAGTFIAPYRRTEEGFEQTLASNYLGHFYLLHHLLPELRAAEPSRVVWMGSAYEQLGRVQWDDIGGEFARDSGLAQYGSANLYSIMAGQELQHRLRAQGSHIDVFSTQPGLVNTPLYDKTDWAKPSTWLNAPAARLLGQSPARGAISTVHCAASRELEGKGWGYYGPPYLGPLALNAFNSWRWRPLNPWAHKPAAQRRLYEETARLLEEKTGQPLPNRLAAEGPTAGASVMESS